MFLPVCNQAQCELKPHMQMTLVAPVSCRSSDTSARATVTLLMAVKWQRLVCLCNLWHGNSKASGKLKGDTHQCLNQLGNCAKLIKSSFPDQTQVRKSEPQTPKTKFLLRLLSTSISFNLLLGRTQESDPQDTPAREKEETSKTRSRTAKAKTES